MSTNLTPDERKLFNDTIQDLNKYPQYNPFYTKESQITHFSIPTLEEFEQTHFPKEFDMLSFPIPTLEEFKENKQTLFQTEFDIPFFAAPLTRQISEHHYDNARELQNEKVGFDKPFVQLVSSHYLEQCVF